ncbi:hypothetical protein [Actinomadura formosensis]|uniref:hypothetical protein n=1 Tax=Actinomadura formosensis TaxID=60706 RepID=UPI003D9040AC
MPLHADADARTAYLRARRDAWRRSRPVPDYYDTEPAPAPVTRAEENLVGHWHFGASRARNR